MFLGDNIYTGKINIDLVEMDQSNLLENMVEFKDKSRPKTKEDKNKTRDTYETVNVLYEGRKLTQHRLKN